MILQERTDAVYGELRRELLRFTPGSRFYSVRQLMLRYGVSRRVIDAAVEQLEREPGRRSPPRQRHLCEADFAAQTGRGVSAGLAERGEPALFTGSARRVREAV